MISAKLTAKMTTITTATIGLLVAVGFRPKPLWFGLDKVPAKVSGECSVFRRLTNSASGDGLVKLKDACRSVLWCEFVCNFDRYL